MFTEDRIQKLKQHLVSLKPTLGGKIFFYIFPFRKKVVLANMQQVFGSVFSKDEIKKLALAFYSHMATSFKENFFMRFKSLNQIKQEAEVLGEEHLWDLLKQPIKGAIILTGHFGNWEFAPIAGILNFTQFEGRFYFVRRTLVNKFVEKILFRRYYQAGLEVIPKKNCLAKVCDVLEKNNAVVFVMDQHASTQSKDGVAVDFFGKKAGTFKSVAMISRYTQVPVLPTRAYRRNDGKHIIEFFAPVTWQTHEDPATEIAMNTRAYNQILEGFILDYPEQWLWMHRRWKAV